MALEKFARNQTKEGFTTVTARLIDSKHERFKAYCDKLGLSLNEAINLLIDIELNDAPEDEQKDYSKVNNKSNNIITAEIDKKIIEKEINISGEKELEFRSLEQPKSNSPVNNKSNTKRFILKEYTIDGQAPCPICNDWRSSKNLSRHVKSHGYEATEHLYNEHMEKVLEMVKSRIEAQ